MTAPAAESESYIIRLCHHGSLELQSTHPSYVPSNGIDLAPTTTSFQREFLDFLKLLYTTHKLVSFQHRWGYVAVFVQYTLGRAAGRRSSRHHLWDVPSCCLFSLIPARFWAARWWKLCTTYQYGTVWYSIVVVPIGLQQHIISHSLLEKLHLLRVNKRFRQDAFVPWRDSKRAPGSQSPKTISVILNN